MASNYRFFPKLIISLVFISLIILFIRRAEYLEKYNDFISEAVDTVAVDTLAQIPETPIYKSNNIYIAISGISIAFLLPFISKLRIKATATIEAIDILIKLDLEKKK